MFTGGHLLTAAEAAERLNVTQQHVTRLARNGVLAPVRVKPYLFKPEDVDALRLARTVAS